MQIKGIWIWVIGLPLIGLILIINYKAQEWNVRNFEAPIIKDTATQEALDITESRRREDILARKISELQYQVDVMAEKEAH